MRKLATFALALATLLLCAIVPLVLFAGAARAADLPSELSGTYAGSGSLAGWECEIRAYALQPSGLQTHVLAADCAPPDGPRAAGAVSTWDRCPDADLQPPLVPFGTVCGPGPNFCLPPGQRLLSITGYAQTSPACALGEITVQLTQVGPGGWGPPGVPVGAPARMCRTQIIVPTFPYPGCGATAAADLLPQPPAAPYYPRLCRQFGLYCGR